MGKGDIRINACGDILLADFYFDIGYGIGSKMRKWGADFFFDKVREVLRDCDFLVGNLECPISNHSCRRGLRRREFLATPNVVDALARAGFNALSVANNHMSQHGSMAFKETISLLDSRGIIALGRVPPGAKEQTFAVKDVNRRRLGLLAFSLVEDHYNLCDKGYAFRPTEEEVLKQIARRKTECDVLVVLLHWGEEFVSRPSKAQVLLAHHMIEAGCDVILGSHPHVFQGVEMYKGKTIAYSLGNFIFSMPLEATRASVIFTVCINVDGSQSFRIKPIWIDDSYRPTFDDQTKIRLVTNLIEMANKFLKEQPLNDDEYNLIVAKGLRYYRMATKKRFLKEFYRLSPRVAIQLMVEFICRRLWMKLHTTE